MGYEVEGGVYCIKMSEDEQMDGKGIGKRNLRGVMGGNGAGGERRV